MNRINRISVSVHRRIHAQGRILGVKYVPVSTSRIVDTRNDFVGPTYKIDYPGHVTSENARNLNGKH